jgi:hypothetical protein
MNYVPALLAKVNPTGICLPGYSLGYIHSVLGTSWEFHLLQLCKAKMCYIQKALLAGFFVVVSFADEDRQVLQ